MGSPELLKTRPAKRFSRAAWFIASLFWFSAFVGGTVAFLTYEFTPGDATQAPPSWPEQTQLARSAGTPTLLLVAHPHCPCTRASLDELGAILSRAGDK